MRPETRQQILARAQAELAELERAAATLSDHQTERVQQIVKLIMRRLDETARRRRKHPSAWTRIHPTSEGNPACLTSLRQIAKGELSEPQCFSPAIFRLRTERAFID